LVGRDEIQIKAQLMGMMTEHGHEMAGGAIVAAGPNGASPHHHVSKRKISAGDALVVDFGGMVGGYWSDMTRTIHIGEPSKEFTRVYNIVNEANQKAFEAVKPGVTAESIDQAARDHITAAGYGEYFLHRTGHGLGLEIHEPPYLVGGDQTILAEGIVFSIEPGIYIAGKFGVRIEDIVVVTSEGARRFNLSTHDLQVIQP
jgi:D-alanyl-D-alanine dipeptidase